MEITTEIGMMVEMQLIRAPTGTEFQSWIADGKECRCAWISIHGGVIKNGRTCNAVCNLMDCTCRSTCSCTCTWCGFRPDITVMVDWALKINYLSTVWVHMLGDPQECSAEERYINNKMQKLSLL